jgi:hypothetical protein
MEVFDDGLGPALYAGGIFSDIGGSNAVRLARYDGASWSDVQGGDFNDAVYFLETYEDGADGVADLYAGGPFTLVGDVSSSRIAQLHGCDCGSSTYCTAGTTTNGCAASMSATGTPSVSATTGFVVGATNVEGQKTGLLFYGVNGPHSASWGSGSTSFLCVKSPTQRMVSATTGGTTDACDGFLSIDFLDYVATHPGALGEPFSAGDMVWAQLWFRDPPAPKTTNLSDGVRWTMCP